MGEDIGKSLTKLRISLWPKEFLKLFLTRVPETHNFPLDCAPFDSRRDLGPCLPPPASFLLGVRISKPLPPPSHPQPVLIGPMHKEMVSKF